MKNVNDLKKLFFAFMVLGSTFVLSSCSDDDDNTPTPPTTADAYGEYAGKMLVTPSEVTLNDAVPAGVDIAALVKSDTVYFNDFPITELVASIVGEENASDIVAVIGKVNYKVGYKAALNTAQDSVYMTFDPKPLTLDIPGEGDKVIKVEVTISASKKGSYEVATKKMDFDLNAEKVTLGETEFPAFHSSIFTFKLNKK